MTQCALDITQAKEDRKLIREEIDGVEHQYEIYVLTGKKEQEYKELLKDHGFGEGGDPLANSLDFVGMSREFIALMVDIPAKRLEQLSAVTVNKMVEFVNKVTGLTGEDPPKKKATEDRESLRGLPRD